MCLRARARRTTATVEEVWGGEEAWSGKGAGEGEERCRRMREMHLFYQEEHVNLNRDNTFILDLFLES